MDAPTREPDRARLHLDGAGALDVRGDPSTGLVVLTADRTWGVYTLTMEPLVARELAERLLVILTAEAPVRKPPSQQEAA